MKRVMQALAASVLCVWVGVAAAQGNLEVNTPSIAAIRSAMKDRYTQLEPLLDAGAVGLARDGGVVLRNPAAVPLAQRAAASALVAAENQDRDALYREIARANGHPEWEADVRNTFATRWHARAKTGWFVQNSAGQWVQK